MGTKEHLEGQPRRRRRKKSHRVYAFFVIVLGLAIIALAVLLLFHVQNIEIKGNEYCADKEILEAVRANIQAKRPVGPAVTVDTAGEVEITVSAGVTVSGTTPGAVQAELESRLKDYLAQLVRGKYQKIYYGPEEDGPYSLIYNRVLALLLSIEGVENFSALTVNGTTADVMLQADQVPVLKEVSVT